MRKGKICISVFAETAQELLEKIRQATELADIIEVRIDGLRANEIAPAINGLKTDLSKTQLILTYRSLEQGGIRASNQAERRKFWQTLKDAPWAIDLEEGDLGIAACGRERIVSFHDLAGVPDDLEAIFERLAGSDADIVKIAVTPDDIVDAIPLWKLLEKAQETAKPIIAIAMGEAGGWTRILGLSNGGYLTYASLEEDSKTAPGQFAARELREVYRASELDRDTAVYGVIGDPISGSLSPYMHNAAFADAGLNAVFLHLPVRDLDGFIRRMVRTGSREIDLNFAGFAVTMPHKQAIMTHLDEIDPIAEKIGAVNTVKIESGRLIGFNTDADGFIEPLKTKYGDLSIARVAVFGTGGAARACVYALKRAKADVTVISRDAELAAGFGSEFDVDIRESKYPFSLPEGLSPNIIVNATPVGMKKFGQQVSALSVEALKDVKCVYDLVTDPVLTPLMKTAASAGSGTISGIEMLVAQGERQFEIWTGQKAPSGVMRAAIREHTTE